MINAFKLKLLKTIALAKQSEVLVSKRFGISLRYTKSIPKLFHFGLGFEEIFHYDWKQLFARNSWTNDGSQIFSLKH